MKLNYEEILYYQTFWKDNKAISCERANGLIELSNKFMQRVKDNDDEVEGVTLFYPDDCSDYNTFTDFAFAMSAYVRAKAGGGLQMSGWGLNRDVEVK